MQTAVKVSVVVSRDHLVRLPDDVPEGPAEVIVLFSAATEKPGQGAGDLDRMTFKELLLAMPGLGDNDELDQRRDVDRKVEI